MKICLSNACSVHARLGCGKGISIGFKGMDGVPMLENEQVSWFGRSTEYIGRMHWR